jgi:general secretion pathway protein B
MSLILEALRRSEAERQIGRAPGLMTPVGIPPRRRRMGWPWLVAALFLVGAAGWYLGRGELGLPTLPLDPDAPAIPIAAPPVLPEPATTAQADSPQPTPVATPPPDVASAEAAPHPFASAPPEPVTATASTPAAGPAPAVPPAAVAGPSPTAPAPSPAPTAAAPVRTPTPPSAEPLEVLPSIAVVPPQRRSELPPLRVSMHVYAEDPAQRFVLIDGRRHVEGQMLQGGVTVHEIRRDGVVLVIDGTRVLLARP